MKKQLTLLAACALVGAAAANATCWRINPSPFAKAQFQTVDEAMADINVLPGDTLLLDPGAHSGFTINRENVTVIGPGYNLDQNKNWSESQTAAISGIVSIGKNCTIEGCQFGDVYVHQGAHIKRCRFRSVIGTTYQSDVTIEQCLVFGQIAYIHSNWIIRNNIIPSGTTYPLSGGINNYGIGSIIENNVIVASVSNVVIGNINHATIRNNIIINNKTGFDSNQVPYSSMVVSFDKNNVIQNNVLSTPERYKNDTYSNYYVGATVENTFVNEGSDDAKWQLLDTSAAKGAATHGGDCGAFGGATPYVLSGIPMFLPHITEALVPAKPTDGKITVKLKIENQNE